jgi:hypothetical protein
VPLSRQAMRGRKMSEMDNVNMIELTDGFLSVGILPMAGGRIVSLRREDGCNLLKSDPALWTADCPVPSAQLLDFTAYNGHEVWVGPQSQWWKHQDINLEKRESDLFWPPDPYISYGRYRITSRTACSLVMVGPDSPVSGIRFTKRISLDGRGGLRFEVEACNIRPVSMAWDLWMLTRTDGHNPVFVPVASPDEVRVGPPTHSYEGPAPYEVLKVGADAYFTFTPELRDASFSASTAKAFIHPSRPFMATLSGDSLLVIHFEHHDQQLLHPEQTEVELYNYASEDAAALMEMEYHAPYVLLQPGLTMSACEFWQVLPYVGSCTREDICRALKEVK